MAIQNRTFTDLINFTRGTGATRINAAGLIVGVDFSSTSNTITTGSKTFTLTADANVNRDWSVGSSVIAVSQAGATGTMTGTVTSYTPSTQALVINVTSITGSGTSTNWRIGSLEVRRDSNGVLVEGQHSTANLDSILVVPEAVTATVTRFQNFNSGAGPFGLPYTQAAITASAGGFLSNGAVSPAFSNFCIVRFFCRVTSGTAIANTRLNDQLPVESDQTITTEWKQFTYTFLFQATNQQVRLIRGVSVGTTYEFAGIEVYADPQGIPNSVIPVNGVAVTRAADSLTATATTLAALRQGEGTLVVTAQNPDNGIAQKRALRLTGANGEIRIAKQGVGTTANFTKMVEGDGLRLMGTASGNSIKNDGLESGTISVIEKRTGANINVGTLSALTFNGAGIFAATNGAEEVFFEQNLSVFNGIGITAVSATGCHYTGTSFLSASNTTGIVIKSNGTSYRRINTPVITQSTNEVTSGLVGATNRVVIVGNNGFIATSDDDGETWTARTSGTASNLNGASFGSVGGTNYFIAVGNGTARYSTDGINWLAATGATGNLFDIHIANGIAVAVNTAGLIFTSTNGTSFTQATNSNTTNVLAGVTYSTSLNLWVSCGAGGTVVTATNPSGTWTLQSSGVVANLNEVSIFNNAIYVVGDSQTLLTSTNGTTYTSLTAGVTGNLIGIAASPTTLLITGQLGAMASSTNGTTFTSRTNNGQTLNGIAFGAGKFVSVGNTANGSGYIATIDADGTVTRRVSNRTTNLNNVRFLGAQFLATGLGSTISTSTDGLTWTSRATGSIDPFDVAYSGSLYVAVGAGGGQGRVSTSVDGATWGTATSFTGSGTQLNAIDFANGVFVLVGNGGVIATTTNGTTYTLRTSGTTQNLTSVMYSTRDSRWYAAGNAGTLLFSEDNGATWQSVQNAGLGAITNSGVQASLLTRTQWQPGTNRIVLSYKNNSIHTSINGFESTTDKDTGSIPTVTSISIGDSFNGYISSISFDPRGLSAADTSRVSGGGTPDFAVNSLSANSLGDEISVNNSGDTLNA